jgi:HD-GYP domain-containing protein (c-di-GMP phosphodiesterase class II)
MKILPIAELQENMISNQTVCDAKGTILIARGVVLTRAYIQGLKKFNIKAIQIQEDDNPLALCSLFTPTARQAINAADNKLTHFTNDKLFKIEKNSFKISQIIYSILARPPIQSFLEHNTQHQILYNHSIRTTIFAINMGLSKGYDYLNLEYLAMSALIHDYGMGQLFLEESADHPIIGFTKIRENPDLDMIIALVCLQHHEHFDGSGTFSFCKTQITEFARLISIADYYDRLIMKNNTHRQAIFKILSGSGTLFDPDMVKIFEKML